MLPDGGGVLHLPAESVAVVVEEPPGTPRAKGTRVIVLSDPGWRTSRCGTAANRWPRWRRSPRDPGPGERDPDGAYGRARAGVCARLRTAVAGLPAGWGFLVVEGHRSSAEQARRFARYQDRLAPRATPTPRNSAAGRPRSSPRSRWPRTARGGPGPDAGGRPGPGAGHGRCGERPPHGRRERCPFDAPGCRRGPCTTARSWGGPWAGPVS
ncbi:hypothetical protein O1L55_01365 [Streptomyces albulus]|nr:hypothetical protein [Streptomyces noursei]